VEDKVKKSNTKPLQTNAKYAFVPWQMTQNTLILSWKSFQENEFSMNTYFFSNELNALGSTIQGIIVFINKTLRNFIIKAYERLLKWTNTTAQT
jgi:hypothetical protein